MSAFRLEDAETFFGREVFLEGSESTLGLVDSVQRCPIVAVIGSSGSGKSSVIFAGLLPRLLAREEWLWISFRPGNRPFYNLSRQLTTLIYSKKSEVDILRENSKLAKSLRERTVHLSDVIEHILKKRGKNINFLVIIDQFEEIYTLCQDAKERENFLQQFLETVKSASTRNGLKLRFVFTVRADFYGDVLAYRPFRDILQQYPPQLLSGMTRDEMRQAIECPATQFGIRLEEKLADRILDDVGKEPGNLPLMEFALTLLWNQQQQGLLTHVVYSQIGGVKQALANHAEKIYDDLSEFEKQSAQKLFLQLVHVSENAPDTRKIVTRSEVSDWSLVTYLASQEARLVVTGYDRETNDETVEVVHEALIRGWGRLRQWIFSDRQFRLWQENLRFIIRQWSRNGKDEGSLLRGQALTEAREWFHTRRSDFSLTEEEYIETSLILERKEQRTRNARRRRTIIGLLTFSIIALSLSILATIGWSNASIAQANAEVVSRIATAETMLVTNKEIESLFNGLQAGISLKKLKDSGKANNKALAQTLVSLRKIIYSVKEINKLQGHESSEVTMVDVSPDGNQLISSSLNDVRIWNLDGSILNTFKRGALVGGGAKCVRFSPDGKIIALGGNGIVTLYDIQTENSIQLKHGGFGVLIRDVSFSPDGKIVASAGDDGTTKLWDRNGNLIDTLSQGHTDIGVDSVSFSPDGKKIATGSGDRGLDKRESIVKLWNKDGTLIKDLALSTPESKLTEWVPVDFSPDGQWLATAAGNLVQLWSSDGSFIRSMPGHMGGIRTVAFSPDSQLIASGGYDSIIRLWKTDGTLVTTFKGHDSFITSLRFNSDGKRLASSSQDSTIRIWEIEGQPIRTLDIDHSSSETSPSVNLLSTSSNENLIATVIGDAIEIWEKDGSLRASKKSEVEITDLSFSPDGEIIAVAGISAKRQHQVELLTNNGKHILDFSWNLKESEDNDSSENNSTGNSFQNDGTVLELDVDPEDIESENTYDNGPRILFDPKKKRIFSFGGDDVVRVWNYSGKSLFQWEDYRAGIGIGISYDNNSDFPIIAQVSENSPAFFAGLKIGDKIIKIDGVSTKGLTPEELFHETHLHKISSRVGETVNITVLRDTKIFTSKVTSVRYNLNPRDVWHSAVISPRKRLIILGTRRGYIKVFNLDGTLLKVFRGHNETVSDIDIDSDEKLLVSASARTFANLPMYEGSLKLWEIDRNVNNVKTLARSTGGFLNVSFYPDSDFIATASGRVDSPIEIYQSDGNLVGILGENIHHKKLQFSADGNTLISAGSDPSIILWNFSLEELLNKGCNWLKDYLSTNQNLNQADRNICQQIVE